MNDPNLRSAYTVESAATVEQQVGKYASVTVTYLNARGFHQFMTRNIPIVTTMNGTTNVALDSMNQSEGIFFQNQINTNINIRTPKGTNIFGYYSANWADSNDASITDPFSSSVDYGRARFSVRSRLSLGGNVPLPFKISASPFLTAQSGNPYSITTGVPELYTVPGTTDKVQLSGSVRAAWAGLAPRLLQGAGRNAPISIISAMPIRMSLAVSTTSYRSTSALGRRRYRSICDYRGSLASDRRQQPGSLLNRQLDSRRSSRREADLAGLVGLVGLADRVVAADMAVVAEAVGVAASAAVAVADVAAVEAEASAVDAEAEALRRQAGSTT